MKTAGIVLLAIGLLMTLYTGFTYVTRDNVARVGGLELSKDNNHLVDWQPYIGIDVMVIGTMALLLDRRKPLSL